ncbi:PA14 domain-containing protein [Carboxylicivirga caseinilyticus]|uniref:PA14 domain-containing protein n=1 Tax=Carboxylicivirga caseinilyticus TaxID=3417572 RepID=UPI003D3318C0|nr:Ig-like domain-containing protein [Marinilabiliaceae bacterium A049]
MNRKSTCIRKILILTLMLVLIKPAIAQIVWPSGQLLPSFPAPQQNQDLIYLNENNLSSDEMYLFASLKGVVNMTQPRIFSYEGDAFGEGPYTWLESLNLSWTEYNDPWILISKYIDEISGIIVYDADQLHTVNLATMLAHDQKALVASPALVSKLTSAPYNLPILTDLRGKYASKMEVYQDLYDNYWSGLEHRLLIGLNPAVHKAALREYAVALGVAVIWLDPDVYEELLLLRDFLQSMTEGASFMGWWPEEAAGVKVASIFGVATIASDWSTNLTMHSGMPRCISKKPIPQKPELENKLYVAFILSDGDNLQYVEHLMRKLWNNPDRGSVPLGWTVSPAMVDAMPGALNYYWQSSTENDNLVSGPSGFGYSYPNYFPNQDALNRFVTKTEEYNKLAGLRVITIWNTITGGIDLDVGQAFAEYAPTTLGLTGQDTGAKLAIYNNSLPGKPLTCNYCWNEENMLAHIGYGSEGWDGNSPRFILIQCQPWQGATPTTFKNVANSLDANYEVVRPDHLFQLLRESNGLDIDPGANLEVSGVTITPGSILLSTGETEQLTAIVTPNNSQNRMVSWSSDNSLVATVSEDGIVTAHSEGSANITVTTLEGGYSSACTVEVSNSVSAGNGLNGYYYNGLKFETPIGARKDANINFNWGTGSPMVNVNNDNFSINWSGQVKPSYSGTYTFYLTSDNGRRLWIDNKLVIDALYNDWDIEYSGTMDLNAGQKYDIRVEYFEYNGGANCKLEWSSSQQYRQVIPQNKLFAYVPLGNGLAGNYYNGKDFEDFITSRVDSEINFDWGDTSPVSGVNNDLFSVRWNGFVLPQYTENYTFKILSDNGCRLWINDKLIINAWGNDQGEYSGSINLKAGIKSRIQVDYCDIDGAANCAVEWSSVSQENEIVPKSRLYSPVSIYTAPVESVANSVDGNRINDFEIYPNPVDNNLKVLSSDMISGVKIFNVYGQIIYNASIDGVNTELDIDTSELLNGIYIINLTTANSKLLSKKFIKR